MTCRFDRLNSSKTQRTKTETSIWHRLAPKFKELVDMFDDNTDESVILRFENLMDKEKRTIVHLDHLFQMSVIQMFILSGYCITSSILLIDSEIV